MQYVLYLVMGFGALIALVGVFLSTKKHASDSHSLKILGFEFQLSGYPMVIFITGCMMFTAPPFLHKQIESGNNGCIDKVMAEWNIYKSHSGDYSEAVSDMYTFEQIVLNRGCINYPYKLKLDGKQRWDFLVWTISSKWSHQEGEVEYMYTEYIISSSLIDGEISGPYTKIARKVRGTSEPWHILK